jgi:hypothetical protein
MPAEVMPKVMAVDEMGVMPETVAEVMPVVMTETMPVPEVVMPKPEVMTEIVRVMMKRVMMKPQMSTEMMAPKMVAMAAKMHPNPDMMVAETQEKTTVSLRRIGRQ